MEHELPLRLDRKGLCYLEAGDVSCKEIVFRHHNNKPYEYQAHFYTIDGTDNYIIKDCTMYPLLFNRKRNLKLLKELINRQKYFTNIDFPIAYYKSYQMLKGIVIPYYKDSLSLYELLYFSSFSQLKEHYNHESNEIDNLISLLLDILELISTMYYKGMCYVDINSSNFVFYKNNVKVIDFEPSRIYFKDRDDWYLKRILSNYELLVEGVSRRYNFKPLLFNAGDDFYSAEESVKGLKRRLER